MKECYATQGSVGTTAAAPASEVEAVVRSPTNMAAADIAAVDFNKMTSLDWPACGHVCWGRSASQSTASNASAVLIGRKKSREYLILVYGRHCRLLTFSCLALVLNYIVVQCL